MKKCFFFFFILIGISLQAQHTVETSFSAPYKGMGQSVATYLDNLFCISDQTNFYYVIRAKRKKVSVSKVSLKSLEKIDSLDLIDFPANTRYVGLIKINHQYHLLYHAQEKGFKMMYVRAFDLKKGVFEPAKLVFKTKLKFTSVDIHYSADSSKILFSCKKTLEPSYDTLNHDTFEFYVIDEGFNTHTFNNIQLPHNVLDMTLLAKCIANAGDIHMLGFNHLSKQLELYSIVGNFPMSTKVIHGIDAMFYNEFSMFENKYGNFTCVGFYDNGDEYHTGYDGQVLLNANGMLKIEVTKDAQLTGYHKYPFTKEFIAKDETSLRKLRNQSGRDELGIVGLRLVDVIVAEDGSVIVIGEPQNESVSRWGGGAGQHILEYGNLVVLSLNAQNELRFTTKVLKEQLRPMLEAPLWRSVRCFKIKESLVFFYPENKQGKTYLNTTRLDLLSGKMISASAFEISDLFVNFLWKINLSIMVELLPNQYVIELPMSGNNRQMLKMEF